MVAVTACRESQTPASPGQSAFTAANLPRLTSDDFRQFIGRRETLVLASFWAPWCAPCIEEIPILDALQAAHGERLTIVGLLADDPNTNAAAIDAAFEGARPHFQQAAIVDGIETFLNDLGCRWDGLLPRHILLASDGAIRADFNGALDAEKVRLLLLPHLGPGAPPGGRTR